MQFDLICDDEWKRTVTNSLFMFGMLVGGVTIGMIGDMYKNKILIED